LLVDILVTAILGAEILVVASKVAAVIPPDILILEPVALVNVILLVVRLVVLRLVVLILVVARRLFEVTFPEMTSEVPLAFVNITSDAVILVNTAFPVEILVAVIRGTFNEVVTFKFAADILVILTLVAVILVEDNELELMVVEWREGVVMPVETTIELPVALVKTVFSMVALFVLRDPVLMSDVARMLDAVMLPDKFNELPEALVNAILAMDAFVANKLPADNTELKMAFVANKLLVVIEVVTFI
jgi:hypothetical protein